MAEPRKSVIVDEKVKEAPEKEPEQVKTHADVAEPITGWLLVLFIALFIRLFFTGANLNAVGGGIIPVLLSLAAFILFLPGSLILPLIVGAAIGTEVGLSAPKMPSAQKGGLLNGVYTALVYSIAIVIVYEVLINVLPSLAPTMNFLVYYWLIYPVIIIIALCEVFAIMSYARKVEN